MVGATDRKNDKICGINLFSIDCEHIDNVTQSTAKNMYAIKLLKSRGMNAESAHIICNATVLSRLVYAAPAWWGFTNAGERARLQAIMLIIALSS